MTRLIIIRHGETDSRKNGVLRGQEDIELNEKGELQAEKVARRLSDEEIEAVYSSDLERASRTAEKVAGEADARHTETEALRERDWGLFEGRDPEERRQVLENGDQLDHWRPEKGENLQDIRDRVTPVIDRIEQQHSGETAVVVAHAWVNRAIITELLDSRDGRAHSIKQANTGLNLLEKEEFRGWRISRLNDTSHLQD